MLPTTNARPVSMPGPSPLAAIVLVTATLSFVAGLGAAHVSVAAADQPATPAPTFDAVKFRAEEREPLFPSTTP
jgi:hypothetical protein